MEPLSILVAFIFGFGVYRLGLPPLVGYLIAGFALQALGIKGGENLETIADIGVMLLLFTIGLKLKLKTLARPEIWAGASVHMLITVMVFGVAIFAIGSAGVAAFAGLDLKLSLLVAFALSFSSTVFAVKALEDRGEMTSLHGRVAIGILIMQDIYAVLFLTFSTGKIPSPWALALVAGLIAARPLLIAILNRVGHRELVLLFSIFLALGLGAAGFDLVKLKPDLGALFMGILLAGHPKTEEMSNALLSIKDLFLVGFFLTIGLAGAPTLQSIGIAGLLTAAVVFKVALFFLTLSRFRLRARTSLLASLSLANYSEFGLLVAAIGVKNNWIGPEWLITIAIALSISFIAASPLNTAAHRIYERWSGRLKPFETKTRHPDDQPLDPGDAEIAVFGIGRIGTAAYDDMREKFGEIVIGIDFNYEVVEKHRQAGRNVITGDATDIDFWERVSAGGRDRIRMVILAMSDHTANLNAIEELNQRQYTGRIAAMARFDDEVEELGQAGAHVAYNIYSQAGFGFAEHVCLAFGDEAVCRPTEDPTSSR
jgi:predicted Kef-type K+ transport protein